MKADVLVFAAHPDDAELSAGGTIASLTASGKIVGIIDLTQGELGTRGTPETRKAEAEAAAKILGLTFRDNLQLRDGFFRNDEGHQIEIIKQIRKYRPEILLINAPHDRHPDHGRAGILCREAAFLSGLKKIETDLEGEKQQAWRPKNVFHYIQSEYIEPDFVLDVSDFWHIKKQSVQAYKSQFYDPNNPEENTFISSPEFLEFIEARARELGQMSGFRYAEGFIKTKRLGLKNLFEIF
jgi:bacillithiol biosynthesis deacetylase BshB1